MTIQHRVRRKVDFFVDLDFEEVIETGGKAFPDGYCIELVKDPGGLPALLDSKSQKFHQLIDLAGQKYIPPPLEASVLEALILPTKRTDCVSTVNLFGQIFDWIFGHGVSEETAKAFTFFALASWFPDCVPVAPCLMIDGPEADARIFLALLKCVVRHALLLPEINNVSIFEFLPMHAQPTMLIGSVSPSMWRIISASNHLHAHLPLKRRLTDLYSMKAVYSRTTLDGVGGGAILNINCTLSGEKLPIVNGATLEKNAANFQSKLVDYRFKHVARVQDADFDATNLPTPLRMLARSLGSCIVDAPELQAAIVPLLESQAEELRVNRVLDPNFVTIEAMFAHCHSENGPVRVGVGEIATTVTAIMGDRGETAVFESKRMGSHLRFLGFHAKRDSKGFAIHLTPDVRRLIHRLARDHQVGDSEQTVPGCPHCTEVMSTQAGRSNP